jgi:hypothetical protein
MTISSTTNRVSFAGNGSTTAFSFPYYFLASADLVVISKDDTTGVETVKTLTTHYTVTGAGVGAGGTVTMLSAPASGTTLIIYRDPSPTQTLDLVENDNLPAESLERAIDKGAMVDQRLKDRIDRSVTLSEGFTDTFDPKLPADLSSDGAGKVLMINDDGDGFADMADSPTGDDIINAQTYASDAASSASAAATSASASSTSATASASSATAASGSATAAAASAVAAAAAMVVTAKGDLVTHNGSIVTKIAVGSNDKVLMADSAQATGIKWGDASVADGAITAAKLAYSSVNGQTAETAPAGDDEVLIGDTSAAALRKMTLANVKKRQVSAKTGNYTVVASDEDFTGDATGGAFTFTLYTAVGNKGRKHTFTNIATSTNAITIDGNSTETINEALTFKLYSKGESVTIESDNANWIVVARYIPSKWESTLTFTPTNFGTTSSQSIFHKRVGDSLHVRGKFKGGTIAASPAYITLPYSMDTAKIPSTAAWLGTFVNLTNPQGGIVQRYVYYNGSNADRLYVTSDADSFTFLDRNASAFLNNNDVFSFEVIVPVSGWEG